MMEKYGKPRNILICCNFFVCSKFCALVLVRESCFWVKVLNTFHLKPSTPQSLSSAEDVTLFEQAGLACAPMRRMHGKHKAPVLPSKRPEPVKAPTPAVKRPAPSGKAKAKAKAKAKIRARKPQKGRTTEKTAPPKTKKPRKTKSAKRAGVKPADTGDETTHKPTNAKKPRKRRETTA